MLRVNTEVRDVHKRGTGDKGVGCNVLERQAQGKPYVSGVGEQGIVVVKSSGYGGLRAFFGRSWFW